MPAATELVIDESDSERDDQNLPLIYRIYHNSNNNSATNTIQNNNYSSNYYNDTIPSSNSIKPLILFWLKFSVLVSVAGFFYMAVFHSFDSSISDAYVSGYQVNIKSFKVLGYDPSKNYKDEASKITGQNTNRTDSVMWNDLDHIKLEFNKKEKVEKSEVVETTEKPITEKLPEPIIETKVTELTKTQKPAESEPQQPPKIDNSELHIFILTRRDAFDIRQTIRNSWIKNKPYIHFMIGDYCPNPDQFRKPWLCEIDPAKLALNPEFKQTKKLINPNLGPNNYNDLKVLKPFKEYLQKQEALNAKIRKEESSDVVILPMWDTYRNITLKVKESYKYLLDTYPSANWFAKVDDDQFCRPEKLKDYVANIIDYSKNDKIPVKDPINSPIIIGKVRYGAPVMRKGKWGESKEKFAPDKYPPFPIGSAGHVINRKYAQYISDNKDTLVNYQGEDVAVGIWMDNSPLKKEALIKLSGNFENNGQCQNKKYFIVGHQINTSKMKMCSSYL